MPTKKLVTLLVLTAILAATAAYYFHMPRFHKVASVTNKGVNEIKKTDFPSDQFPAKFPTDIPIEAGATITQNYNATTPDGRFQATRVFETQKSLAENFTIYKNYLASAGYNVQSTSDKPTFKMIYGVKGKATLQVSIDENTQFKIKTVNISYTELLNEVTPASQSTKSTK